MNCVNFSQKGNLSCRLKSVGLFCSFVLKYLYLFRKVFVFYGEVFVFVWRSAVQRDVAGARSTNGILSQALF